MLNDILPPKRQSSPPPSEPPMKTKRLQGQTPQRSTAAPAKGASTSSTNQPHRRPEFFWRLPKKQRILAAAGAFLVFGLLLIGVYKLFFQTDAPPPAPTVKVQPKEVRPVTVASPLTGAQIAPELAKRPVTAIMIENSPDARPQAGLQDAGIVFEAIAEGGITRFMALYQESRPQFIGPVRSLRPYYIDMAAPFQASIAHVGGSPEALSQVRSGEFRDLDQFFNAGAYWRYSGRPAPHNVFTSFDRLDGLNKSKGFTTSQFAPWTRKTEQKPAAATVGKIDINISSALYNVHYDYDLASNSYLRSEGGRPHIAIASQDDKSGHRLSPKTVVVLVMNYSLNGKYSVYGVTGSGEMYVFQDGGMTKGTWTKPGRVSAFSFKDEAGNPLTINPGQTWVTLTKPGTLASAP